MTFPSEGCRTDLARFLGTAPDTIDVIGNPVDIAAVCRQASAPIGQDLELFDGHFVFVHLARLDDTKNHPFMIEAVARLRAVRDDFVVLCVRDGADRARIEALIRDEGLGKHVLLVGECSNPLPILSRADALLLTSRFGAFALVLVEAMALGVPVVSVDSPSGPGEVLGRGEFGVMTPVGDVDALAQAMARVIEHADLRESLRAKERAAQIVKQWESLIDRATPRPAPATDDVRVSQSINAAAAAGRTAQADAVG